MKILLLLSSLVAPSLAALLIPRSEYIQHELFIDSEHGIPQCDDCCAKGVELDFDVQFFGKKHNKFWPCANGLISFNDEVRTYTPNAFPISNQPMVAAYWGDVDLRTCRERADIRCSYWKVYYGDSAKFLDDKITRDYFRSPHATFRAKVAIVQTWDNVGYYDQEANKLNTFQIVIVSDGFENAFAGFYYGNLAWTTGDSSDGIDGLGGTPAQMGFDAGDNTNFMSHKWSRTADILKLQNKEFLYAISTTIICQAGEELIEGTCTPLSCNVEEKFAIHDRLGNLPKLDNGLDNPSYTEPIHVAVGECDQFLTAEYRQNKVLSGSSCALECVYNQNDGKTFQPRNTGNKEDTDAGVSATCDSATWSDTAAQNCVEVGINQNIVGAEELKVRESPEDTLQMIEVSLKSRPFTSGSVAVEVRTSCKNGQPLQTKADGSDTAYFCNDDLVDPNAETEPLAKFQAGARLLPVTTLTFNQQDWDKPQQLKIKGTDNTERAAGGFETFKVFIEVVSAGDENCDSKGCAIATPYGSYEKIEEIEGHLLDNEGLEVRVENGKMTTDENGGEALLTIDPVVANSQGSYAGDKIKCVAVKMGTSEPTPEATVTGYKLGNGAKQPLGADGYVTFPDEKVTFVVTGNPDNVVDGPQKYQVSCELEDTSAGTILPVVLMNEDKNVPGVYVNTTMANNFVGAGVDFCQMREAVREDKMVDGCGVLTFRELSGEDQFTVQLATQPLADVVIFAQPNNRQVQVKPDSVTFTPADWNKPQTFTVSGNGDDEKLQTDTDGLTYAKVSIEVDTLLTQDKGMSTIAGSEVIDVLGYANCFGAKDQSNVERVKTADTTTTPAASDESRRRLQQTNSAMSQEEADAKRQQIEINCFSYDSSKITGKKGTNQADHAVLSLDVEVGDDTLKALCHYSSQWFGCGAVTVGGMAAVIIAIVVVMAISAAVLAASIKKKREEEHERKAEVKKGADNAEAVIDFRMDEMDDMEDLENPASKLKAERDRLKDENEKLAAEVGEEPMMCANTEDPDVLVEQIKSLKGENDRLRDMQSGNKVRTGRKKKKKAQGFGQQKQ